MQLIIHAGIQRTGTTALQGHLARHAEALRSQGIHYPATPAAPNQQELGWALRRGKISPQEFAAWVAEVRRPDCERMVLSAEVFCTLRDLSFLEELQKTYGVTAVFYLRRQDEWINSWYNLVVKLGLLPGLARMSPDEFLGQIGRFHWLHYADMLGRWASAVGTENLRVRVYEPAQMGDVVSDFLTLAGAATPAPVRARSNASLPADQIAFLRALNLSKASRRKVSHALAGIGSDAPTMAFSPATRRALLAAYRKGNAAVARLYLGRTDGRLFVNDTVPAGAPWYTGDVWAEPERLKRYVAAAIRALDDGAPTRPARPRRKAMAAAG